MKNFKLLFIMFFLSSCFNSEQTIKGNWYTLNSIEKNNTSKHLIENNEKYTYTEFFVSDDKIYRYNNFMTFLSPQNYKYQNDSLFIIFKKESFTPPKEKNKIEFIGKVKFINKNSFAIISKQEKLVFKKIYDNKKLSDYIISKNKKFYNSDSIQNYSKAFFNRFYKQINK